MSQYYLGVDPGKKGGLALINNKLEVVALELMPKDGNEFYNWALLYLLKPRVENLTMVLEKVASMPRQSSQSVFSFGKELGKCQTILDIVGHKRHDLGVGHTVIIEPSPQAWIKPLPITKKVNDFKTKTLWKRYLRSVAKELFPKADIWTNSWWNEGRTDAVSDAMLLAYYGWLSNH